MKLKAVMEVTDAEGAAHQGCQAYFLHILQVLQRLERASERKTAQRGAAPPSIVLKWSEDGLSLCHRAGADEGSQTWAHFTTSKLFQEYRIESKRDSRIDLEAPISNLVHVFHNCANCDRTTMRLANGRDSRPILSFEFALPGNVSDHRVQQEVPVRVIPESEAASIAEPALPEPEYQIELPHNLMRLKILLDKMMKVGAHHVLMEAAQEKPSGGLAPGRAFVRWLAEADVVTITATFPSLSLVMEGKKTESPEGPVRLLLSLRRLAEVLSSFGQIQADAYIACVLQERALVLYALLPHGLGSLISYTPAVLT